MTIFIIFIQILEIIGQLSKSLSWRQFTAAQMTYITQIRMKLKGGALAQWM